MPLHCPKGRCGFPKVYLAVAQGKGTLEWSGMQRRWEQLCRWSFLRRARLAAERERERGKRGVREGADGAFPRDGPASEPPVPVAVPSRQPVCESCPPWFPVYPRLPVPAAPPGVARLLG